MFANKLLENLLHWARSQTGKIEYKPEPINLRKLSFESIELLKSQALKKSIDLSSKIDPLIEVNADRNMLETIIRNLVSNALKFTPENGKVRVTSADLGNMVEVSVVDSGIGMSQEDVKKLFRIDVKNSEIGKSKEKGTGLGLILCKEFVERHGGIIWVESELEHGSKFNFTLPKLA